MSYRTLFVRAGLGKFRYFTVDNFYTFRKKNTSKFGSCTCQKRVTSTNSAIRSVRVGTKIRMSGGSRLDHVYRSMLMTKFFTKGWGKPENLKRLFLFKEKMTNREACYSLVPSDYPVTISKEENYSDCRIMEGHFLSPFVTHLPGIVPVESETAYFQIVLPKKWNSNHYKPICLHLAGTGDHGFWRRRQMMAKPLLKGGIASIILENPFYGLRKPKDQIRSSLHNVSDILVMGGCLILESLVLFHWCESNGLGPLGVTGMSMGGHMASLAATNWPKPIVLVPCLSWSSATPVFTQGVMSHSINWDLLCSQYFAEDVYREEITKLVRVDKDAFRAGQYFAKHFPQSMDHIHRLSREEHELSKQKEFCRASQLNPKSVTTEGHSDNSNFNQQTNESSPSNCQAVISSCNASGASNYEVYNPSSNRTLRSKLEVLAAESKLENVKESVSRWREGEALLFMHGIMDECTNLQNFSVPVDTSLIIAICARNDAYVPREGCADLTDIWPEAEVRILDAGHISAYLLHKHAFREAIIESFQRLKRKYIDTSPEKQMN
ncbi:Protein ABHD18 [Cryptotermes secundus]|uniref:Protein ABHD18 n=1 Tax=Cryptotermes secundus TaxID=105785 RepID=A0A2J7PXB9_9NEOP|nr:protein ABHD18 isoform X2 [Cryptotermes secundus]PNF20985.1 Protein ABHD18 [Cryptotermes secundus]